MKVFVCIYQMQAGGAARVTSVMLNGLAERGINVVLCTDSSYYKVFYPLSNRIKIITYNPKGIKENKFILFPKAILKIRKFIKQEQPDIVIGVEAVFYFFTKLACMGIKKPVVAVDHTSMSRNQGRFINWIRNSFYGTADALSLLTYKDAKIVGDKFPQKIVIHNPMSFDILDRRIEKRKNILCVGRLNGWDVKGFDLMLDIWKRIESSHPEWILEIAGGGSPSAINEINEMIKERNLNGRVKLLGQIKDICSLYQSTSIFALSSRVEGFPMCLAEAMSQGCSCIAFNVQGAVPEIIENNVSGIIIDDRNLDDFACKLNDLILDESSRSDFGRNAIEKSKEFSADKFIDTWLKLLYSLK